MTDDPVTDDPVQLYLSRIETLVTADQRLSALSAGILAALELGIASDSTAFCRALELSHALVLREIDGLRDLGLLDVVRRDARTSRTYYRLAGSGVPG